MPCGQAGECLPAGWHSCCSCGWPLGAAGCSSKLLCSIAAGQWPPNACTATLGQPCHSLTLMGAPCAGGTAAPPPPSCSRWRCQRQQCSRVRWHAHGLQQAQLKPQHLLLVGRCWFWRQLLVCRMPLNELNGSCAQAGKHCIVDTTQCPLAVAAVWEPSRDGRPANPTMPPRTHAC